MSSTSATSLTESNRTHQIRIHSVHGHGRYHFLDIWLSTVLTSCDRVTFREISKSALKFFSVSTKGAPTTRRMWAVTILATGRRWWGSLRESLRLDRHLLMKVWLSDIVKLAAWLQGTEYSWCYWGNNMRYLILLLLNIWIIVFVRDFRVKLVALLQKQHMLSIWIE
jgi:hypothetical protein